MKQLLLVLTLVLPLLVFPQGEPKKTIDWIPLKKAEKFSKKYNKNILIMFHRPNCEFCERMKKETLSNTEVVKLINENFFPVMLNGRGKDTITYNGKKYGNQQPIEHGATWRHDLFAELVDPVKGNYYWPSIVIVNRQYEKLTSIPGFQPKQQLLRTLKRFAN